MIIIIRRCTLHTRLRNPAFEHILFLLFSATTLAHIVTRLNMVDLRNGGSQLEAQEQSKGFLSNLEVWVWMIGDCDGWCYKLGEWSPRFGLYYQSGGCACDADLCINICQFRSFDLSWRSFPSEAMEEGRSSSWLFCKLNTWAALVVVGHLMTVKMKHLQMLKLSNSS